MTSARQLLGSVLAWPVATQQGSRRNAMIASTALAERRRERDEVERFLATRVGARAATDGAMPVVRRDVI